LKDIVAPVMTMEAQAGEFDKTYPPCYDGSSMVKKVKMPENVLRFFRQTGSEGGKARAEKHTREELSKWGKKGGRPRGSGRKQKGTK
jgi:hypothetical protein